MRVYAARLHRRPPVIGGAGSRMNSGGFVVLYYVGLLLSTMLRFREVPN